MKRGLALGALLGLAACGRGSGPPVMDVVLITLDTTRRDALGCFGGPPGVTPHLDALAAESLAFDNARTTAPLTLPSHASMLTGLWPPRHGVRDNALTSLPDGATTLAERLADAGYATAGFLAAAVLGPEGGLDQGFDTYEAPSAGTGAGVYVERPAHAVTRAAERWLAERESREPYFLWAHYFDPHAPLEAPAAFVKRAGGRPYLGEVALMDDAIGKLLAAVRANGDWSNTLVIVVADHGEDLGDHGELSHGAFVYDSTMSVPLLLRLPSGERAGERSDATASVADVFPTVLDALGLAPGADVDGVSLLGAGPDADRGVYFESYYGWLYFQWSPVVGWADRHGKTVQSSAPEHFDPAVDPGERTNRFDPGDATVSAQLAALRAVLAAPPAFELDAGAVDEERLAALRALGYAAGTGQDVTLRDPFDAAELRSPHAAAQEFLDYRNAIAAGDSGRLGEALRLLDGVVAANPRNHEALHRLGLYAMQAGRNQDAIRALERFTEVGPEWPYTWFNLALCLDRESRHDEALTWYRRAVEVRPDMPRALGRIIELLDARGDAAAAAEYRARLAALDSQ
jgi:arylsulfatase A-like enzyme